MKTLVSVARNLFALFTGSLAALVAFGLLLVTALAFLLGGYVAARTAARDQKHVGLVFGLFLGLISFAYVLGAHWSLLLAVPVTTALSATGARLARRRPVGH